MTNEVLDRHLRAFGKRDMPGILGDYAPHAVIFTPGGAIQGRDALEKFFTDVFAEWAKPGATFALKQRIVDGNHAYIYWDARTADNHYEGAMDGFVVENGKIVAQFFAAKITPAAASD